MSHELYETWIFEEVNLSDEQLDALEAHLAVCSECRQLKENWDSLSAYLATPPVALPSPGFVSRWQSEIEERKSLEQKWMVRRLLLFLFTAAALTSSLLFGVVLVTASPLEILVAGIRFLVGAYVRIDFAREWFALVLNSLPPVIPLMVCLLVMGSLGFLTVIWTTSMWRIATKGVKAK